MFNPCYEHCYLRYGKQYTEECDNTCDYAKICLENKKIKEKKKVVVEKYFDSESFYCPSCGKYLGGDHNDLSDMNYCQKCGQSLEWDN